jgi:hypothetical protein
MAYITDLTHFDGVLEPGSKAPAPARRLARFLTEVVRVVSRDGVGHLVDTGVKCFKRPKHKACAGHVEASWATDGDTITWGCPDCGEQGFIHNWRGGAADLSRFARQPPPH